MGELHLESWCVALLREFNVEGQIGAPQFYREPSWQRQRRRQICQTGTRWQGPIRHVVIEMELVEPGTGFGFVNKIVGGYLPKDTWTGENGMKEPASPA